MARIDVKAIVSAPAVINIPLVRADYHETSNIFRIFFEISISLFSGLLGYILTLETLELIHYVTLFITGIGAISFISICIYYNFKSKNERRITS